MTALTDLEAVAGALLLFFLPGYATTRAMFPEWRIRGSAALRRSVEIVTLSFVLSVTLTVLVGYLLLTAAPGGFQASWSDPVLETTLAGVAIVAFGAGALRGAYGREAPARQLAQPEPGGSGAWELTRELDRLGREERRLQHALRVSRGSPKEAEIRERLAQLEAETNEVRQRREAEYAG